MIIGMGELRRMGELRGNGGGVPSQTPFVSCLVAMRYDEGFAGYN